MSINSLKNRLDKVASIEHEYIPDITSITLYPVLPDHIGARVKLSQYKKEARSGEPIDIYEGDPVEQHQYIVSRDWGHWQNDKWISYTFTEDDHRRVRAFFHQDLAEEWVIS